MPEKPTQPSAFIFEDKQIRVRLKNKTIEKALRPAYDSAIESVVKPESPSPTENIFNPFSTSEKRYFSIGEVAERLGIAVSKVRFWVESFELKLAKKNSKGDRFFTLPEAEQIAFIAYLLEEKKYTIEGAKKIVHQFSPNQYQAAIERLTLKKNLEAIKDFLIQLRNGL